MLTGYVIILVGYVSALAYLPLQAYAALSMRGLSRILSIVPLLLMVPVFAITANAYHQQSNLWPILMIFAAPVATLYLMILIVVRRTSRGQPGNTKR